MSTSVATRRPCPDTWGISRWATMANDGFEIKGQIHQQLLTAVFGKKVNNAVQRLLGIAGVQGGQHQVSRFGKGD